MIEKVDADSQECGPSVKAVFAIPVGTLIDFPKAGAVIIPRGALVKFSGHDEERPLEEDHEFTFSTGVGLRFETSALIQVEESLNSGGTVTVDGAPCTRITLPFCTKFKVPGGTLVHVAEGKVRMEGKGIELAACSGMGWTTDTDWHVIQFDPVFLHIESLPAGMASFSSVSEKFKANLFHSRAALATELASFSTEEVRAIATTMPRLFRIPQDKTPGNFSKAELLEFFSLE